MELFKITCVTCQAKLSVRNKSLIGQIIACPRCESMVQVERPASAAVAAATLPTEPVEASSVEPATDSQPADIPESVLDSTSRAEIPVPPEAPPVSTSVAKYKMLTWTLGAFVAGAALVGAILLFRSDSAANIESPTIVAKPPVPVIEEEPSIEVAEVVPETEVEVSEEPPVKEKQEPEVAELKVEETVPVIEAASEPKPEPSAEVPKVARRFDPLQFDLENLDLATINKTDNTEPAAETSNENVLKHDNEEVQEPLPSTLPSVRRDAEQTIELAVATEKLKQRFPSLKVNKMPLNDFLSLVSHLASVPVSIASEELIMAGFTARRGVSLDAKDIDLHEALSLALDPLHLEYVVEGPMVRVVRKGGEKLREVDYPLDDLSGVASVEEISSWIEQLVGPTEWHSVGGTGTIKQAASSIKISQIQRVQYQVLIFLERLRLANNLPPKSRFPIQRFYNDPIRSALEPRLTAPTVFTFSQFTALQEVIQHWQAELGVPVLVDWPALAEVDIWPQTRIACSIDNKPWHTALSEVLEPLGLGWRTVAGEMIEITSLQKVQTQPQLEIYALSQAPHDGADRLLAELNALAEVKTSELISSEPTEFDFQSGAKTVFALQPAAVQRKVYRWLVQNRLLKAGESQSNTP